jgi:hypothetical protein
MQDDERCCGTGTCIIDAHGLCWCGQQWNGVSMCRPTQDSTSASEGSVSQQEAIEKLPSKQPHAAN